jgi:hypothetical protein
MMSEGEAYLWNMELEAMRWRVRYALDCLDNLAERNDVKGALETVLDRLDNLCDATKGEDE